jgi:energy-coupling factor transport system permease protein
MLHPFAWVGWLGAILVALSTVRNPLYLILILLCIAIVRTVSVNPELAIGSISALRFALLLVPLSAALNAAMVHFGDTVLLRLPQSLPVVGGPITLEALFFGATNGLILSGMFAAFGALNQALPVRSLIRLIPRAFYQVSVVVSIALTFVPTTLRQLQQIREAQAIRGHRLRGLRDWLPLFLPLLVSGLERALQLAEAMTARGFASVQEPRQDQNPRTAVVAGLLALLSGWLLRLVWDRQTWGWGLMLLGAGLILGALWVLGRQVPRTTYRQEPWRPEDWAVLLSAALVLAILILPGLNRSALFYYPYPALSAPDFDPWLGLATLGLLGPVWPLTQR